MERKKGGSTRITTCTTDTLPSWHKESLSRPLSRREECISKEIPYTPQPSKPYLLQVNQYQWWLCLGRAWLNRLVQQGSEQVWRNNKEIQRTPLTSLFLLCLMPLLMSCSFYMLGLNTWYSY